MKRYHTRVQLEFTPDMMNRLRRLKSEMEATSYAEVIRRALIAYALPPLNCGHKEYRNGRCAEMMCHNYVNKGTSK